MPLVPAGVLDRKLTWDDFDKVQRQEPGPDESKIAALTASDLSGTSVDVEYVENSRPHAYKATEATITVNFNATTSWVAQYVIDKWPADKRDALLKHEQTHFMITAVSGRDYQAELDAVHKKTFPSVQKGLDAVQAIVDRYTEEKLQGIQNKYDADTKSDPSGNAAIQGRWNAAVEDARKNNKKLRSTLKAAGLIP